jgi:hypothetical protein
MAVEPTSKANLNNSSGVETPGLLLFPDRMAKHKKKQNRERRAADDMPTESQAADAMTVGWMLAILTTLLCQVAALVMRWIAFANPQLAGLSSFSAMLFFGALIIGLVTLALIPVLYKIRVLAPPTPIVAFAVVVGLAPWVTLLMQWVQSAK